MRVQYVQHITYSALIGLVFTSASAADLFKDDFEDYSLDGFGPERGGVRIVNAPREGNYAGEFSLSGSRDQRTEATIVNPRMESDQSYTITFSNKLADSWNYESGAIVFQVHKVRDPGDVGGKQPLYLRTRGGTWFMQTWWDDNKISTSKSINGQQYRVGDAKKGRWYDWKIHVKLSYRQDGKLEVWRDGQKVIDRNGPNCFNDQKPNFMKYGIYSPVGGGGSGQKIYYDNVRLSRG